MTQDSSGGSSVMLGYLTHPGHESTSCACLQVMRPQAFSTSGDPRRPHRELHRLNSALKAAPWLPCAGNLHLTPSGLEPQDSHCKCLARSSETSPNCNCHMERP
jgi:hypothetical protein